MNIMNILSVPSFYAHVLNAFLIFVALLLFVKNYTRLMNIEPYQIIKLTLLFSISIGIHGISHLGLEKIYEFNPIKDAQKLI